MTREIMPNILPDDRGGVHGAGRLRHVHGRHAVVPRRRHPAALAGLGSDHLRDLQLIPSGQWWPTLFPALAIASAGDRHEPRSPTPSRRCRPHEHWPTPSRRPLRPWRSTDLEVAYKVRGVPREVLRGVTLPRRAGRGLRPGGRVRLRQVDHRLRRAALPAGQRPHHRRPDHGGRGRRHHDERRAAALVPRPPRVDGVPGPWRGPEPDPAHRAAGRSSASRCSGTSRPRPSGWPRDVAAAGAHRRPRVGDEPLPLPAVRRHAAARGHRHGAGLRSAAAGAGRAHHRARRHGGGGGAGPGQDPAPRDRRPRSCSSPTTWASSAPCATGSA